ncbi:MAG: TetR/AcrR family transcriptional regulator [Clostridia bacterium]|nr:TetR/AcrR family transcriptional regulator [Clostridia bacterium]
MEEMNREDRRVRRTRRLLEEAFTQLLEKKPLKDISVKELAELADINKGTFYKYYGDIYDFVKKVEDDYFVRFVDIMNSHGSETVFRQTKSFLLDCFTFIKENSRMVRVLLSENGDVAFREKLIAVVRDKCHEDWIAVREDFPGTEKEFNYRYAFVTSGCLGIIREWVAGDCRDSITEMTELTDQLIRQGGIGK